MKNKKIGIVGVGMVGGAMHKYFEETKGIKPLLYDPGKKLGSLEGVNKSDIVFLCVPTPYLTDGKPARHSPEAKPMAGGGFDLSYVKESLSNLNGEKTVVIKSTVLPGTTENLQKEYKQHKLLFNPEFLTEATADQDMNYPDRQIVGYTKQSHNVAGDIMQILPLAPFERVMPATEAEMVKYFGNTWFAVKVSFANQIYDLCEKIGLDYETIKESAAADKRIGRTHLDVAHKGYRGYGGKCLPKDIRALIQLADSVGVDLSLHKTAEEINNRLMEDQGIDDPEKYSKRD